MLRRPNRRARHLRTVDSGRRRLIERHIDHVVVRIGSAPGSSATTIGSVVFLRPNRVLTPRLHRHEYEHVLQYQEFGIVGFLRRYLFEYLVLRLRRHDHRGAYLRLRFEIQAEWRARRSTGIGIPVSAPEPRESLLA